MGGPELKEVDSTPSDCLLTDCSLRLAGNRVSVHPAAYRLCGVGRSFGFFESVFPVRHTDYQCEQGGPLKNHPKIPSVV